MPTPSSCHSHLGSEHQKRAENGQDKENDQTANLQLEGQRAFPSVQDSTGDQTREHGALRKKD